MDVLRSFYFKIKIGITLSANIINFLVSLLLLGYEPWVFHAETIVSSEAKVSKTNI